MLQLTNYTNFVLKDITLTVKKGQNLTILGDNGAGKTTLAKVLSGIIENQNTTINKKPIANLYGKERSKHINYIPPKLEIFDEYLTVFEFLELSQFENSFEIATILELLQITHLRNKFCQNLSSGEAGLVLFASSIIHNATCTILDEINSNLDPQKQKLLYEILKNQNFLDSKIIITHNLNFAFKLGFEILYLQEGTIQFYGACDDFFEKSNLESFFGTSVKKIENSIVVDL